MLKRTASVALFVALALPAVAQERAPIVQPGAPGKASRLLTAEKATQIADTSYAPVDVEFMTDMIPHHHQALEMSKLVGERTNRPEIVDLAKRIEASQSDEIAMMQQWLRDRGEPVPNPMKHDAMKMPHKMAGMATPEQMKELATLKGIDFDRIDICAEQCSCQKVSKVFELQWVSPVNPGTS